MNEQQSESQSGAGTVAPGAAHAGIHTMPTLSTGRLLLRPVVEDDAPAFQRICADAEVASMSGGIPHPYPDGEALDWIRTNEKRLAEGLGGAVAITLRETEEVIGDVTLRLEPDDHRAEIGFILGRDHWGAGYAAEAAGAVTRFALTELALNRVYGLVYVSNTRSARVFEKMGYTREARLRQNALHDGVFEDDWLFAMLRTDLEPTV
ncbi:MAG: GNAT family N-acetyltransferase [Phycisphaerales bacterium]